MAGMKEQQILVVIKEPGKSPRVEPLFDNTLEAFQTAVGGFIETVTIRPGLTLICNEDGRFIGLPHNVTIYGIDFVGTVIAVAYNAVREFISLKGDMLPYAKELLKGDYI